MKMVQKHADLQLQQTEKQNTGTEWRLKDQIQQVQEKLQLEVRVHEESKNWLHHQHKELQQQFEWWQLHFDQISQEKQQQVDERQRELTQNSDRLTQLKRKFRDMEQVVLKSRQQKEMLRRQLERQQEEITAVTMIQAWWRGCMVRRGLGPFKKGTKSKDGKKKGKKAKGKK
ncbi:dynein regulatory complex protein 9 [Thalassophryne amazonica]|uniref:dynein regulatory complex protein 9 n=1 Tax=Thalassophryne amazonica TaxID=390379 RepID=UPI001471187A|nr:dynein regulatory complex protein 9 [Thalassophryne amazonica]